MESHKSINLQRKFSNYTNYNLSSLGSRSSLFRARFAHN